MQVLLDNETGDKQEITTCLTCSIPMTLDITLSGIIPDLRHLFSSESHLILIYNIPHSANYVHQLLTLNLSQRR